MILTRYSGARALVRLAFRDERLSLVLTEPNHQASRLVECHPDGTYALLHFHYALWRSVCLQHTIMVRLICYSPSVDDTHENIPRSLVVRRSYHRLSRMMASGLIHENRPWFCRL